MAKLKINGLDEAIEGFERLERDARDHFEQMAIAGAEAAAEARKAEATARKIEDSGDMIKNIKPTKPKRTDHGIICRVYSQGVVTRGKKKKTKVRNAEKEYLEHYGYKGRTGSHWVDGADAKGADAAEAAIGRVVDQMLNKNG